MADRTSEQKSGRRRRDYRTGSVYQRCEPRYGCPELVDGPDGKVRPPHACKGRWFGSYDAGWTATGTRRRPTVSAATEAAVKVKLRQKLAEIAEHGDTGVSSRATVKSWAEEWLPIVERELRPKSYATSASAVKVWIVPTIGHLRFDQLTPSHVRKVADAQRAKGRSSSTQARTHSVLMSLLKDAQVEGYPVAPRLLALDPPAKAVNDRTSVEVVQAVAMLEAASRLPDGSRWVAAYLQGMRQAETLGLRWEAIDFEHNVIRLEWQLQPLAYRVKRDRTSGFRVPDGYDVRQLVGRMHLVRPKSKKGVRVIPMVPWMSSALLAWREVAPASPHGLVWPTLSGEGVGGPRDQKKDDAAWYALQDAALVDGKPVRHPSRVNEAGEPDHYTIHEARHTTATLLLEAGVDPVIVAAILGQSKMLDDYIHLSAAHSQPLRAAMEKVAERLALPAAG